MKRVHLVSLYLGSLLLTCVAGFTPVVASADISSATLSFRISQTGEFRAKSITDVRPSVVGCRVALYGRLSSYSGTKRLVLITSKRVILRSRRTDFTASGVPPVSHVGTATDNTVQLNMATITTCAGEDTRVVSTSGTGSARLLDCGDMSKSHVSPAVFMTRLVRTVR